MPGRPALPVLLVCCRGEATGAARVSLPPSHASGGPLSRSETFFAGPGTKFPACGCLAVPGRSPAPDRPADELDVARPRQAGALAAGFFFCIFKSLAGHVTIIRGPRSLVIAQRRRLTRR